MRGGQDERGIYNRPAAQVTAASRIYREPHLMRELLNTHTHTQMNSLLDDDNIKQQIFRSKLTPDVAAVPPTIFGSTRIERRCRTCVPSTSKYNVEP